MSDMGPGAIGDPVPTIPGVLVRVHGRGLLLTGESGIGKSETALLLLDRGHQLIADDAVELRVEAGRLYGRAPAALAGQLEIRGLGPCPVATLFGPQALQQEAPVGLILNLSHPAHWAEWPRLAPRQDQTTLAGVQVRRLHLPVAPERPVGLLVEAVARLDAAQCLSGGLDL